MTRIFGLGRLDLAEDVVQDTLCRALEAWPVHYHGSKSEHTVRELSKIPDPGKLEGYPFYPAAQGEFHFLAGRLAEAAKRFEEAIKLARSQSEKDFFERKLRACRQGAA